MAALTNLFLGVLLALFCYGLVVARRRQQVLALALAGVLAVGLISPPPAAAQGSLVTAIQSVLNVINGLIKTVLNSVNSVRGAVSDFYQQVAWPVVMIDRAKATVKQMTGQYNNLMRGIFGIDLRSATLPNASALEDVIRSRQTNDCRNLVASFGNIYGALPTAAAVSPADRTMMDMDDALALGTLKTVKESDRADDITLHAADDIESAASQAAPGSAPFLTATAVVAGIRSQALTQKLLAAELRQEGARMAHENALRKRGARLTGDVNTEILNLLKRK